MDTEKQVPIHSIKDMQQLIKDERFSEAESSLRIIVNQEPKNPEAWFFLGTVLLLSKRPKEARDALEKATKLGPKLEGAWQNLAGVYRMTGDTKKAEKAYQKAAKLNPKDAQIFVALSEIYKDMGKREKALEYMKQAKDLNPHFVDAFEKLKQEYSPSLGKGSRDPSSFLHPVDLLVSDFSPPWMLQFDSRVRSRLPTADLERQLKIPFGDIAPLLLNIAHHCMKKNREASMHAIRNYTGLDAFSVGSIFGVIGDRDGFYFTLRSDYSRGHDEMFTFHRGKNPFRLF